MSGMEMMLTNMLKAFMPKESAEKIAGWASDGTFDKIGNLPSDLEAIKRQQAQILLGLGRVCVILQERDGYGVSRDTDAGPSDIALAERRALGGPRCGGGASGEPDAGPNSEQSAA